VRLVPCRGPGRWGGSMHVDPWLGFKRRIGEGEHQSARVGEVKRRKDKERQVERARGRDRQRVM
jgi:hypothetical protein